MNLSALSIPPTDPATTVADYEALRASFLASRVSPATRSRIRRLLAEGLHAWLATQPSAQPAQPADPLPITTDLTDHDDLIQLMACMTLRSLNLSEKAA